MEIQSISWEKAIGIFLRTIRKHSITQKILNFYVYTYAISLICQYTKFETNYYLTNIIF